MARKLILRAGGRPSGGASGLIVTPAPAIMRAFARGAATAEDPPSQPPPGADEPFLGSDAIDVEIWTEEWAGYTLGVNPSIASGGWSKAGGTMMELLADAAFAGGRGLAFSKPGGETSIRMSKAIPASPVHYFESYEFKFSCSGDFPTGKQHILEHDAQGLASCAGSALLRYEWPITHGSAAIPGSVPVSRLWSRATYPVACDGPVNNAANPAGTFVWTGAASVNDKPPLLSTDPNIAAAPWGAINDGGVHRITTEVLVASTATSGVRLWLDGFLVQNCMDDTMSYPGHPTLWKYDTVSQPLSQSSAYVITFGRIRTWKRAA